MQITGRYYLLTVVSHLGMIAGVLPIMLYSGWIMRSTVGVLVGSAVASFFLNVGATTTLVALRKLYPCSKKCLKPYSSFSRGIHSSGRPSHCYCCALTFPVSRVRDRTGRVGRINARSLAIPTMAEFGGQLAKRKRYYSRGHRQPGKRATIQSRNPGSDTRQL